MKWLVIICVVVGLALWLGMRGPSGKPAASSAPVVDVPAAPKPLPAGYDPSKKAEREKLIEELQKQGLIGSLDLSGHCVSVEIKPLFEAIDFDKKRSFAGLFFAWGLDTDLDCRTLLLERVADHHVYATYSPATGFTVK